MDFADFPVITIAALTLFALGIIGCVVPIVPGNLLVLAGVFIYRLGSGDSSLGTGFLIGESALALSSYLADYLASAWGVKRFQGSSWAAWGAVIGVFAGLWAGPLGLIIGPLAGAVTGELLSGAPIDKALRVGFGSLLGLLAGTAAKLILAAVMILWFYLKIGAH